MKTACNYIRRITSIGTAYVVGVIGKKPNDFLAEILQENHYSVPILGPDKVFDYLRENDIEPSLFFLDPKTMYARDILQAIRRNNPGHIVVAYFEEGTHENFLAAYDERLSKRAFDAQINDMIKKLRTQLIATRGENGQI